MCQGGNFVISSVEGGLHLKLTERVSIITDPLLKNDVPEGVAVMLDSFTGCCDSILSINSYRFEPSSLCFITRTWVN